jgi:F0F1-type ATP synthase delta subunit
VVKVVSDSLSRSELKEYLRYLKEIQSESLITVTSAHELSGFEKRKIEIEFEGKSVNYVVDSALLIGVKIESSDFSYELSANSRLENVLTHLNMA